MAETLDGLKVRIRELEKEVERWKSQVKSVRYGLNWMDVPEAFDKDSEDKIPILEEVAEKAVDASGPLAGKPPHVIIEGDNYHALTCLNYTHRGKIDVIYIDPPYNTGSDGFTYKDKRFLTEFPDGQKVPKEHPLRHSYWLSFMEKRLKLAKNLLSDKGVIFISIDDNEQANLKLLCDKVFGEGNFVANLPTIMNLKGNQDEYAFAGTHEYTLVCSKYPLKPVFNLFPIDNEKIDDWSEDEIGYYKKGATIKRTGGDAPRSKRPYSYYPILVSQKDKSVHLITKEEYKQIYNPLTKEFNDNYVESLKKKYNDYAFILPVDGSEKTSWRWKYDKVKKDISEIIVIDGRDGFSLYKKQRPELGDLPTQKPKSTFYKAKYSSGNGTAQIKEIFGAKVFNNPKPLDLIKDFIMLGSNKNSIVLDFFAGSGTTFHAVSLLNEEDDGCRKCILVQAPEKTFEIKNGKEIALKGAENAYHNGYRSTSDITYERNRRVMCGYTSISAQGKQTEVEGLGGSLKYYKTGFVGKHQSKNAYDADNVELAEKAGCLIALAENTLETVVVPSTAKGFWQIYSDNAEKKKRYTCIYHNGDYGKVSDFVAKIDELRATDKKSKFTVYVFSWNSPDFFENEFDDLKNIEIKAIPKPILEIYKALNG